MKKLIVTGMVLGALSGCKTNVGKHTVNWVGGTFELVGKVALMPFKEIKNQLGVDANTDAINANTDAINALMDKLRSSNDRLYKLEGEVSDNFDLYETLFNSFNTAINRVDNDITELGIDDIVDQLDTLEEMLEKGVAEVIDPCGDKSGYYDEVIIKLHDDTFIGYFESGSKRFLTVLKNGNYRTTDEQKCRFTVLNGQIID